MSTAEGGGLKASRWRERLAVGSAPAPLTTARADGCLHFGDLLQLRHAPSGAALAVDVHATANIGSELRAASFAAAASDPVAHTTFLLSPYVPLKPSPLEPTWDGDVVRWGQKLHVIVNPMAAGEPLDAGGGSAPLFLASAPLSVTAASKFTRHQLVGFTGAPSYSAVWTPQPIDPALRGSLEGAPVPPGTPLLLVHAATQAPLCLEEAAFANDYGVEREVTAHLVTRLGMQTGLAHLAKVRARLAGAQCMVVVFPLQFAAATAPLLCCGGLQQARRFATTHHHAHHQGDDLRALPKAALGPNHMCFVNGSDVVELPPGEGPHYDLEQLLADIAGDLAAHPGGRVTLVGVVMRAGP